MRAHNAATGAAAFSPAVAKPELGSYYRWDEPDTNLTVLLKPETVDRLQTAALAEIDPRAHSGDEVGGVLLGWTESDNGRTRIVVEEFEQVYCEHRKGPSYSLSREDNVLFEAALDWGRTRRGCRPVGYWRSHLRRGMFLSSDDLALIHRHFPDPESVFLLIKPLANGACTAGLFFWKDNRIQAEFTGSEVPLIPVAVPPSGGEQPPAAVPAATAARAGIRPAQAAAAPWSNPRLRRIAGYGFAGVAVLATAAVLAHRPSRPAAGVVAPKIPHAAARALTESQSAPQQAVSLPPRTPKPAEIRTEAMPAVPMPKPEAEPIPATSKPFVLPSRRSLPVPAEATLGSEPAPAAAAPAIATVPMSEPAVEGPAPPPQAMPLHTTAINPPAAVHTFTPPRVIHQVTPAVPRGVGPGITSDVQVDVEVSIDAKGKVTDARVRSTKGAAADLLTIEALKAAQLFRFQPAEENGRAVPAATILTFRFSPANNRPNED